MLETHAHAIEDDSSFCNSVHAFGAMHAETNGKF